MVFHGFYKHFRLAPINLFALVLTQASDFAAQGQSESDFNIFIKAVFSMSVDHCFFKTIENNWFYKQK